MNYSNLKAAITAAIRANGAREITGNKLQEVLKDTIDVLGAEYQFGGTASPSGEPDVSDERVVYLAFEAGTYTNYGGLVLANEEVALLVHGAVWDKETLPILKNTAGAVHTANIADHAVTRAKLAIDITDGVDAAIAACNDSASAADIAANAANAAAGLCDQATDDANAAKTAANTAANAANTAANAANAAAITAAADHNTAVADHNTAGTDHTRAGSDHNYADFDHNRAATDHTTADADHTRANTDHNTAATDHNTAGSDHTRAGQDHDTAVSDSVAAGTDHTRAGTDHDTAVGDHNTSTTLIGQLQGYDTHLNELDSKVGNIENCGLVVVEGLLCHQYIV